MSTIRDPNLVVSVSEASARYSGSDVGMTVDAGVQSGDGGGEGSSVHADHPVPEPAHHGSSTLLPGLRDKLRSVDDVERDREAERPTRSRWVVPAVIGFATFLLILAASPVVVWIALSGDPTPTVKPAPPPQDDLMGIPVRRGLK